MLQIGILKKWDRPYKYQDCSAHLPATLQTGSLGFAALMGLSCSTVALLGGKK